MDTAKAVIALSAKDSQPPYVVYFNYIDSGLGDRRKRLIEFMKANT